jgi:hypothetical protein
MRKTGWMGPVSSSGCFESTTGAIENLWWSIAVRRLIWDRAYTSPETLHLTSLLTDVIASSSCAIKCG